jgi:hypothetical protein
MENKLYQWFRLAIEYPDGSWQYVGLDTFNTLEEADIERIYLQPDETEKIIILKETRQIVG